MEKLTNVQGIPKKCFECEDSEDCDYWCDAYDECAKKLKEYEDLGLTPEQIKEMDRIYSEQAKELGEYKNAEKQGKMLKLPCAVGDTVYVKMQSEGYAEAEVRDFSYFLSCGFCVVVTSDKFNKQHIPFTEFGKTVFLTKESAEAALKEMEDKHE